MPMSRVIDCRALCLYYDAIHYLGHLAEERFSF